MPSTVNSPLSGTRIWFSGSIPEDAGENEAARVRAFVKALARQAFRAGATVLHGFHPSLTPALLDAAREYHSALQTRAPLRLLVSAEFREPSGGYTGLTIGEVQQLAELQEIPQAENRQASLARLRDALASQADLLVAVGGKWWTLAADKAGVPAEFNLAIARGIPSFLLGGLGGATSGYLQEHPEILRHLRNGLDDKTNAALASENSDVETLARTIVNQASRLPLGRRETESGQRFRILCLDGGGIRGAFTAAVLAHWERASGRRVAGHFDLIAGTSTGGILGIGLGLGLSAQQIVDFYTEHGPEIFPMTSLAGRAWHGAKHAVSNKFDAAVLDAKLKIAYDLVRKDAALGDSRQRLVITSYDLTGNHIATYRTSHHPSEPGDGGLSAAVVARATSAAPTYFEAAKVKAGIAPHEAVDGGVWANCPALVAIGEAFHVLNVPLDRMDLLSIGTAGLPSLIAGPGIQGLAGWAGRAPDLILNAQLEAAIQQATQLLGDRFLRVDDHQPRVQGLDESNRLDYLIDRGVEIAKRYAGTVMSRFVNGVPAASWREF